MKTSEYTQQAEQFLQKHNLTFRAVLIGNDCPRFCEDALKDNAMEDVDLYPRKTHIHGKHYRCTISGSGRGHASFDFWNSYADEEENAFAFGGSLLLDRQSNYWDKYRIGHKFPNGARTRERIIPQAYDLLACLEKNDLGSFEEFCSDFGCDTDSIRARDTWEACVRQYNSVRRFFTAEELAELQEIQ